MHCCCRSLPLDATLKTSHQMLREHWMPATHCKIYRDCFCFHVKGDMSRSLNLDWQDGRCVSELSPTKLQPCERHRAYNRTCSCYSGRGCLFSDMRPLKILSAVAAARAAGVTHIIEEGRYGGLSAVMYALHGFRVTVGQTARRACQRREPTLHAATPSVNDHPRVARFSAGRAVH